ncbi:MAG: hypothetical protein Q4F57_05935 [Weeksellaceae bacterium]|nr:hypothetical protein [Weeksellaceae bacterium]
MKNLYITAAFLILGTLSLSAQVAIDRNSLTNNSVILEFGDIRSDSAGIKGLILPVVDNVTSIPTSQSGTLAVDASTNQVKLLKNNGWVVLSTSTVDITAPTLDEVGDGVVIGVEDGAPEGVLVLNDTTKAMILPHVPSVSEFPNPEVGTWVYDTQRKALAFFNGEFWEIRYGQ